MKEATLRDFFLGTASADQLATEVRDAVEPGSRAVVSDHLHWAHRDWLTGDAQPPSEPEVSTDTLMGGGFIKVAIAEPTDSR